MEFLYISDTEKSLAKTYLRKALMVREWRLGAGAELALG
jgi:hypothetical protein